MSSKRDRIQALLEKASSDPPATAKLSLLEPIHAIAVDAATDISTDADIHAATDVSTDADIRAAMDVSTDADINGLSSLYGDVLHRARYTDLHVRVTWYIEHDLAQAVDNLHALGIPKSRLINDALRAYLQQLGRI